MRKLPQEEGGAMSTNRTAIRSGQRPDPLVPALLIALIVVVLIAAATVALVLVGRDTNGSSGVVRGSGVAATETRDLAAFNAIDLAGSNIVSVRVGGEQSVRVHADDNLINVVTTHVRAGELVIDTQGSFSSTTPMSVDVTVPQIDSITLSGSGTLAVDGVRNDSLTVRLPGSGVIRVSGATRVLDAMLKGSGDMQLEVLSAQDATAIVAGSGRIQVRATRTLSAVVRGTGAIMYSGSPSEVTRVVTGTGAIIEQ